MYCALGRRTGGAQEAARFIAALVEGLGDDGRVSVRLGSSTLELSVASTVCCELEVAVDGDEIELELELKWSISGHSSVEAPQDQAEGDSLEEDEPGAGEDQSEVEEVQEDGSKEAPPGQEAAVGEEAESGTSGEEAAESSQVPSVAVVATEESARPRRGRRKAAAATGEPSFNGVDNAAVRAWAAANGVTVSPRGLSGTRSSRRTAPLATDGLRPPTRPQHPAPGAVTGRGNRCVLHRLRGRGTP
jgi:amphi-Trp domain-containing protein